MPRKLHNFFAKEKRANLCMEKADTLGEMQQRTLVLDFATGTGKLACLCPCPRRKLGGSFQALVQFFLLPEI